MKGHAYRAFPNAPEVSIDPITDYQGDFNPQVTEDVYSTDADTFVIPEGNLRLGGIDAPEIDKVAASSDVEDFRGPRSRSGHAGIKRGHARGDELRQMTVDILREKGFTEPHYVTNDEGRAIYRDTHGRIVGDMVNPETGESGVDYLISIGLYDPTPTYRERDLERGQRQVNVATLGDLARYEREQAGALTETDRYVQEQERFDPEKILPVAFTPSEYRTGLDDFDQQTRYKKDALVFPRRGQDAAGRLSKNKWHLGELASQGVDEGFLMFYNGMEMISDVLDWDETQESFQKKINKLTYEMSENPIIQDRRFFDDKGNYKDDLTTWEGIGSTLRKTVQGISSSAPLMALIAASTAAGTGIAALTATAGAPALIAGSIGLATGLSLPSVVYAGGAWAGQAEGEKDAGIAITSGIFQAALDRLGLSLLMPKGLTKFTPKNIELAAKTLSKKEGITLAAANKKLQDVVRKEASSTLRALSRVGVGAVGESSTEAIQEALGVWGETASLDSQTIKAALQSNEAQERILTGAIIGGAMGGGISAVSEGFNQVGVRDAIARKSPYVLKNEYDIAKQQEIRSVGYVKQAQERVKEYRSRSHTFQPTSLDKVVTEGRKYGIGDIPRLLKKGFQASYDNALAGKMDASGRMLASIFIDGFSPGRNYQNTSDDIVAATVGDYGLDGNLIVEEMVSNGISKSQAKAEYERINQELYTDLEATKKAIRAAQEGKAIPGNYSENTKAIIQRMADGQSHLEGEAESNTVKRNIDIVNPVLNRVALKKNMAQIVEALGKARNKSNPKKPMFEDATRLQEAIKSLIYADNSSSNAFVASEYEVTFGEDARTLGELKADAVGYMLDNFKDFDFVFEKDAMKNAYANARKNANVIRDQMFLGTNGKTIASIIANAPWTPEEKSAVAADLLYILKAERGELAIENKALRFLHDTVSALATVVYLPFVTISSFPEIVFALTHNVPEANMSKALGTIWRTTFKNSQELAEETKKTFEEIQVLNEKFTDVSPTLRRTVQFGFGDIEQSAARRLDVKGASPEMLEFLNKFFKWNGLQGWTQYMRGMRIGLAQSSIESWALTYMSESMRGTKAYKQAMDNMIAVGIDPRVVHAYQTALEYRNENGVDLPGTDFEALEAEFKANMRLGVIGWTNQGVINPSVGSRPAFYSDPRWALFTKFQGFISTFTAKAIPQIINNVYNGTPKMKVSTLTMLFGMLTVGWYSKVLKDILAEDDEDKRRKKIKAYPENYNDWRRAISGSGLLGTGERVLDLVDPVYGGSPITGEGYRFDQNWFERRLSDVENQSPVLGFGADITKAGFNTITGAPQWKDWDPALGRWDDLLNNAYHLLFVEK